MERRAGVMGERHRVFVISVFVLATLTVGMPGANAYVDPGAGSFIFQAMLGGVLAASLAVKVSWRRIVSVFTRKRTDAAAAEERPARTISDA